MIVTGVVIPVIFSVAVEPTLMAWATGVAVSMRMSTERRRVSAGWSMVVLIHA